MIITIDGPAASGKSSAARCLARKIHYYYLYSGLLYRACAYALTHSGGYTKKALASLYAEDITAWCNPNRFIYTYDQKNNEKIMYDNVDITPYLKSAEIDDYSSLLSSNVDIRKAVNLLQKQISIGHNVIADGRDMGSTVFPNAEVKFFLTASIEARAMRWQADQEKKGNTVILQEAIALLAERDQRDTMREHSPLIIAPNAIIIDNTALSAEQTCNLMEKYVSNYVHSNGE